MNAGRAPLARRRPLWLGVLAVAVIGLRALIPTGCMLAAVDGHARLILCPASVHDAGAKVAAHHGMAMDHGMAMNHGAMGAAGMHHADHAATGAEHCPFALSGGAGLVAAYPPPVEPYYALLQPPRPPLIHSVSTAPPPRHHAPRGPPSPA